MKVRLYTLYDTITEESGIVFEARTDKEAQRIVSTLKYPEGADPKDYKLFLLGCFYKGEGGSKPYIIAKEIANDITRTFIMEENADETI